MLLDPLPESVIIDGKEYSVLTDFRDWILFDRLIKTDRLPEQDKPPQMMGWFDGSPPMDIDAGAVALLDFYSCGEKLTEDQKTKTDLRPTVDVMDFDADAGRIRAAFLETHRIDLLKIDYLHWWDFRALLECVGQDTALARVMGYRSADTKGMSKEQKAFYTKMKNLYALTKDAPKTSLQQRNEAMKRYVANRQQDARRQ